MRRLLRLPAPSGRLWNYYAGFDSSQFSYVWSSPPKKSSSHKTDREPTAMRDVLNKAYLECFRAASRSASLPVASVPAETLLRVFLPNSSSESLRHRLKAKLPTESSILKINNTSVRANDYFFVLLSHLSVRTIADVSHSRGL